MGKGCGKVFKNEELNRGFVICGKSYPFGVFFCPECNEYDGIKPQLCDVLAEIEEKEISGGALVRVKDVKEILSKYFA